MRPSPEAPAPNVADRVVAFFSPVRGLKRAKARIGLRWIHGTGGYDAGRGDSNELKRYNPRNQSAVAAIHPGIDPMRSRSRDQARNNPIATGALSQSVTAVVGNGLAVQPAIDRDALDLSDDEASQWESEAARYFALWCKAEECDIEGERPFGGLQRVAFRGAQEAGDILRVRRFLWDKEKNAPANGCLFATKVQLIEADRVSNPNDLPDTSRIAGGVEVDDMGRVVKYHVRKTHPGDHLGSQAWGEWVPVPARDANGRRVSRLLMRHERPGQRRGVPILAPVIKALRQLERFTDAELMAAVVSAFFTVFITSEAGGVEESPLTALDGDIDDEGNSTTGETIERGDVALGSGMVNDLAPGEDVKFANPMRPNAQFDPFVTAILRQIGMALETPYEVLIQHFSSSYSASRGALLEAWRKYRTSRSWLVEDMNQECYEDVIDECVARGFLEAPGYFENPLIRQAYLGTVWTGDAMPELDPLKEAAARKMRIDTGISTIDRESREANGTSFITNHRQRAKEQKLRRDAGLDVEVVSEGIQTQTLLKEPDDTSDDESGEREEDETTKALLAGAAA